MSVLLLIWITVGQGPIVLAVGAGGGCLDIFSLIYRFSFLSPSFWETARYRLKYCLKGPLSPKQPTNQPMSVRLSVCPSVCPSVNISVKVFKILLYPSSLLDWIYSWHIRVGRKTLKKRTQLITRSHPRHLVGKRTAQKYTITDTTSDSQVNSNFPHNWSPTSLSFYNYLTIMKIDTGPEVLFCTTHSYAFDLQVKVMHFEFLC